jgi:hypothetical protein
MRAIDPLKDLFDDSEEEDEDEIELEIPELDEVNLPMNMMENGIVLRDTRHTSNGYVHGLGNRVFTTWRSQGVILYG